MAINLKDTVQIIRGKKTDIVARTGANGELNWADDTYELYIHDGKTRGGHLIGKASGTAGVVGGAGIAVSTSDGISTVSIKRDPSNVLYATTDGAGVRIGTSGALQITAQNALDLRVAEGGGIIVDSNGVKIDSAVLSSVFRYAGQVNSVDDLPSDAQPGDVYDVKDSGANYVWSGTSWDNLGGIMSVDAAPTQGSTNPVASGGVYDAIQDTKLSGDGTTVTINNGIISVPEYEGATADAAGTSGLVPPAAAGQEGYVLGGDGEWHPADSTPVGTIVWSAATQAPNGYLLCNGATVGRATYAALFDAIGTTYGAGDGSTTFALPNLINRVMWGGTSPGQYLAAGLPNITGIWENINVPVVNVPISNYGSGCIRLTTSPTSVSGLNNGGTGYVWDYITIDASESSDIYSDSVDTVQPPALTLCPYIKAFSAATNQGMIDLTALANDIAALDAERLKQIGQVQTFVSTNLPEGWMICDGSSVLFADWPEFQQVYNEGRFNGMTLSAADPTQKGKFVLNGSSGVYLPDLEGLFVQASAAGTAGAYVAPGLPNIKGSVQGGDTAGVTIWAHPLDNGALYSIKNTKSYAPVAEQVSEYFDLGIDASLSSDLYSDNVTTVQPPTVQYVVAMYLGTPAA